MSLNGIDIASYQKGIDLSKVPCDFVIVKATQGATYINPDFRRAVEQALSLGRLIGVYHYASGQNVVAEAMHFIRQVGPYIGKAILALDWEADQNSKFAVAAWAKEFLAIVQNETGIAPLIYMSKSIARGYNWCDICRKNPLWAAQYANYNPTAYQADPWTDKYGWGAWTKPTIYQYSSAGILPGYNGKLDLDLAYLTREEWQRLAGGKSENVLPENFTIGKTYTLQVELNVRKGPGTSFLKKRYSELTKDGQTHDKNKNGCLDKGTVVSCLEVKAFPDEVWIRCPSGWLAALFHGKEYIK